MPIDGESRLPDGALTHRVIEEQERLSEDVLLAVSVHLRVLSEIFPCKMSAAKASVYDYNGKPVGEIELSDIASLLLHNRYVAIKEDHIVDLISDKRFMSNKPQLGLKVSLPEYEDAVRQALDALTVRDLMEMLRDRTRAVSSSSSVKDIVFLTQNLYTLGGLVANDDMGKSRPFRRDVERVVRRYARERGEMPARGEPKRTTILFRAPRFGLEPNLDRKQIRMTIEVNGRDEELLIESEDFFSEMLAAYSNTKLRSSFLREYGLQPRSSVLELVNE